MGFKEVITNKMNKTRISNAEYGGTHQFKEWCWAVGYTLLSAYKTTVTKCSLL